MKIVLEIKDNEKGEALLNFLQHLDFIAIKSVSKEQEGKKNNKISSAKLQQSLLDAPSLTEEELQSIENVFRTMR